MLRARVEEEQLMGRTGQTDWSWVQQGTGGETLVLGKSRSQGVLAQHVHHTDSGPSCLGLLSALSLTLTLTLALTLPVPPRALSTCCNLQGPVSTMSR